MRSQYVTKHDRRERREEADHKLEKQGSEDKKSVQDSKQIENRPLLTYACTLAPLTRVLMKLAAVTDLGEPMSLRLKAQTKAGERSDEMNEETIEKVAYNKRLLVRGWPKSKNGIISTVHTGTRTGDSDC